MAKSIEEQVEDYFKTQLKRQKTKYYTKTESINPEIDNALKAAPSKSGGSGFNYPDIKLFIETGTMRRIPVMIEAKGARGKLLKVTDNGEIDNYTKDGNPNFKTINSYAVNGAVHYANAIIEYTKSYKEVLAIGINGFVDGTQTQYEIAVYYVSQENFRIPKEVGKYTDLSFLANKNVNALIHKIDDLGLTEEEIEAKSKEYENQIEVKLKKLNQTMQDTLKISVGSRVQLVTGMIMAGLGVEGKVAPLDISDLKGDSGEKSNDGIIIINKISSFLAERNLPNEKKDMIVNDLSRVFIYSDLWQPINGESKLKTVFTYVKTEIMPIFTSAKHLDFTGKLFNVLNDWVDIPDSNKNDVVLTPRYVTDLMAKLAQVNMKSYVWDLAVGTAGFLISSMKLMIKDAENRINSASKLQEQIEKIKREQLLGVEKRSDIYLLAVLNMILMGDGSSNIVHKDSLTEYDGKYEQGDKKGSDYPANVFLLNPPYSAAGKGLVFVEKALSKMESGRAAVLIQENAGSGKGHPYAENILKNNTLLASIHMADIFKFKAGVQTAIYLFDVGRPHDVKTKVKFIDFSCDGYTRQNRKKATQVTNLRDTNHARERYEEVANVVLFGSSYLHYLDDTTYFEDTITLNGDDWTFAQHKRIETTPSEFDFVSSTEEYLKWKSTKDLSEQNNLNEVSLQLQDLIENYAKSGGKIIEQTAADYFKVVPNPALDKGSFSFTNDSTKYPYFTRTINNNGIAGYVEYLDEEHKIKGNVLGVGMLQMKFFYMGHDYYAGQFTKTVMPRFEGFDEAVGQFFAVWFNKSSEVYRAGVVGDFDKLFYNTKVRVPIKNEKLDVLFIREFIKKAQEIILQRIENEAKNRIEAYKKSMF